MAAGAQSADAVVVCRELNQTVFGPVNGDLGSFNLDVDLNGSDDFVFGHLIQQDSETDDVFAFAFVYGLHDGNTTPAVPYLPERQPVKAPRLTASTYLPTTQYANKDGAVIAAKATNPGYVPPSLYNPWPGQSGFLGLAFVDGNGDTHYGFVQMSVDPLDLENGQYLAMHLDCVCYETEPGKPIHVQDCAVPEPAGLGALALGAVGLAGLRRRRRVA